MYVCICRAVTDRQIDAAIGAGARTVEGIGRATGAGTDCGQCRRAIARRLGDETGSGCGGGGTTRVVRQLDVDPPRLA